jgi:hypothetical protein
MLRNTACHIIELKFFKNNYHQEFNRLTMKYKFQSAICLVLVVALSSSRLIAIPDSKVFEFTISTHNQSAEDSRYPIYTSTNFGQKWDKMDPNLPNYTKVSYIENIDKDWIVGTDNGKSWTLVYQTKDIVFYDLIIMDNMLIGGTKKWMPKDGC